MIRKNLITVTALWLGLISTGFAAAGAAETATNKPVDEPKPATEPAQEPKEPGLTVSEENPDVLRLPGFSINRKTREIRMDATVCLDSGILEYVVCMPETFEHEAIFVTKAKPELLHAALLLVGLKPKPQPPGLEVLWWDSALKAKESRVTIEVEWDFGGQTHRLHLSDMLRNREGGAEWMEPEEPLTEEEAEVEDAWVFTGSFMHTDKQTGKRFYAANAGGVLVGIWPNPTTVIQYGKPSGNPYRGDNLGMEVNEETVPAKGTDVKLVFSRYQPEDGPGVTPPPKREKPEQPKKTPPPQAPPPD